MSNALCARKYSWEKRLQLAKMALTKTRVYLDQKYWIYCRDAAQGAPQRPIHSQIWELLRALVNAGQVICPACYPIVIETFKQGDRKARADTAGVIDALSLGVAIEPPEHLAYAEYISLLMRLLLPDRPARPLNEMVWTPVASFAGEYIPTLPQLDEATERSLQQLWLDALPSISLSHMIAHGCQKWSNDDTPFQQYQNEQCRRHRHEFRTFSELRMIEIGGHLSATTEALEAAVGLVVNKFPELLGGFPGQVVQSALTRLVQNAIYHGYRMKRLRTECPVLLVGSGIHALVRWKRMMFKRGDLADHLHAASALPFCHLFLTERILGRIVTDPLIELDKALGCRVLWKDEDVLSALQQIASN